MIQALIFDLDGVITDSAEYHYQAWKQLGESIGIPFDRAFNEQLKGISRMDSLERILAHGGKSNAYTQTEKEALAKQKNDAYLQLIEAITPADLLPGIADFIREAKAQGLRLALASASKNGPFILEKLGITDAFETVVDPSVLSRGKPDPEIYIRGAQQLGVAPEQCIGVEDAEAGVAAIRAAGMFSVGIGAAEVLSAADYRVDHTAQLNLVDILKQANA